MPQLEEEEKIKEIQGVEGAELSEPQKAHLTSVYEFTIMA